MIVANVADGVSRAAAAGEPAVVLMHDDLEQTASALPRILEILAERGHAFDLLPATR